MSSFAESLLTSHKHRNGKQCRRPSAGLVRSRGDILPALGRCPRRLAHVPQLPSCN
jgi:hypothetical protein